MKITTPLSTLQIPINSQHVSSNFNIPLNESLSKDFILKISGIYRNTIDDLSSIAPFEVPASPNGPGVANLLFLPLDFYDTIQKFYSGIEKRDYKQVFDSILRLTGMPANALCTAGIYIKQAITLGVLPKTLLLFIPVLNICGLIVYAIEEIGELIALNRQYQFSKKFDFGLINILHNLIENPDPLTCDKSLAEVITYLEKNSDLLEEKFGEQVVQNLLLSFNELNQKCQDEPYFRRLVLQEYLPQLKKISGIVLSQNLDRIQKENLQLNSDEVNDVIQMAKEEYQDKPIGTQKKIIEMALSSALNLKWTNFARNVNPWFVKEANQKVFTILEELQKNNLNEIEEALHEGFEIIHNMEIQNAKKTLTHILGILAIFVGAVALNASLYGCPIIAIVLLSLLAMSLGISRNLVCKG